MNALPRRVGILKVPAEAIVTSIRGPLDQRREVRHELELGTRQLLQTLDVALVERFHPRSHQVHILLRHRLPLEAEVGECVTAYRVESEPRHLAAADMEQSCSARLDLSQV